MSYEHLTPQERYVISHLKVAKYGHREIGRRLGRHHTTISREIKRNGPAYPGGVYWYYFIDPMVEKRRHTTRSYRRQNHVPLVQYVEDKLRADWPPEVIADRVRADHPHDEKMRISHETIYRWVALDARQDGKEFSQFKDLESKTGLSVYFADPYAAWQRGTNENTNGLLRFYFPKGTSFKRISVRTLQRAVDRLNNRPRKCLGYRTPQEVFDDAQSGALAN